MDLKTIENNKMIAEFMGVMVAKLEQLRRNKDPKFSSSDGYLVEDLEYHKSWDWLMPVVVKIKGMNIEDEEMFNEIDFYATSSIENLYSAVVRFIEWVNEN